MDKKTINLTTVSKIHSLLNQGAVRHPLISVIDFSKVNFTDGVFPIDARFNLSFYSLIIKKLDDGILKYGRQNYDSQDGSLFFLAPNQVFKLGDAHAVYGWGIVFHPDLIYGTSLDKNIQTYSFFSYSNNEALHVSEEEASRLTLIVQGIDQELNRATDKHTKSVIISSLELLLNHCLRYYDRQFDTRSHSNSDTLAKIETFLLESFNSSNLKNEGLPTVTQCAKYVNLSTGYLSDLLKKETGKSTQEHIHFYAIEFAKKKLLQSEDTISEIAYELGFKYPQYFSKLFKQKTGITPNNYRQLN
ncbi:helix-turn-helix domain-containing protein [Marinifilum sp.]|uniref:helix-turn-helix domain-containing protein n=1 Tax=Marinifilum sp. TaxID=2033137 RepID=UPI003BA896B8